MSSVARKFLMAISGLLLVGFLVNHLIGNIGLYFKDPNHFNGYVAKLHSWGPLLTVAELGLAAFFLFHIALGIRLTIQNRCAKGQAAKGTKTKGGATPSNVSSRNMAITGAVLLFFLVGHVYWFRFGPSLAEGYTTQINGQTERDLYRLVMETFATPGPVIFYLIVMALLWHHLRHGFWSAFQSLGLAFPRYSLPIRFAAYAIASLLAVGLFLIPIVIFFGFQF